MYSEITHSLFVPGAMYNGFEHVSTDGVAILANESPQSFRSGLV